MSRRLPVDCQAPAVPTVAVDVDCAGRQLTVELGNSGGERTTLVAFVERSVLLGRWDLVGGETVTEIVPLDAPTVALRVVDGDGTDVLREIVDHGCLDDTVDVAVAVVCPAGEVVVELVNTAESDGRATIDFGAASQVVELGAGASRQVVRALADVDEVTVTSRFGDVLAEESLAGVDCVGPAEQPCDPASSATDDRCSPDCSARVVVECGADVAIVRASPNASGPAEVAVRSQGATVVSATAQPGETIELRVPANGLVAVEIDGAEVLRLDTARRCPEDSGSAAPVAAALVALITATTAVVASRSIPGYGCSGLG